MQFQQIIIEFVVAFKYFSDTLLEINFDNTIVAYAFY